jgi:hypothetical protein
MDSLGGIDSPNKLEIKPRAYVVHNDSFITKDKLVYAAGSSSYTVPLVPGYYDVTLTEDKKKTEFTIFLNPSASAVSVYASTLLVSDSITSTVITPENKSKYSYTAEASDAKYISAGECMESASYSLSADTSSYVNGNMVSSSVLHVSTHARIGSGSGIALTTYPLSVVGNGTGGGSIAVLSPDSGKGAAYDLYNHTGSQTGYLSYESATGVAAFKDTVQLVASYRPLILKTWGNEIWFTRNSTKNWKVSGSGDIVPFTSSILNFGSPSQKIKDIYAENVYATSSWANNAVNAATASYALFATDAGTSVSSSFATDAGTSVSSSFADNANKIENDLAVFESYNNGFHIYDKNAGTSVFTVDNETVGVEALYITPSGPQSSQLLYVDDTGKVSVATSTTSSFFGTASLATSASFARSASWAPGGGTTLSTGSTYPITSSWAAIARTASLVSSTTGQNTLTNLTASNFMVTALSGSTANFSGQLGTGIVTITHNDNGPAGLYGGLIFKLDAGMHAGRFNSSNKPFTCLSPYDYGSGTAQDLGRVLYFGGGVWDSPDANNIQFYTAPTYTETKDTGLLRMHIGADGTTTFFGKVVADVDLVIPDSKPTSPSNGSMYFDNAAGKFYLFNGATWRTGSLT